MFLYYARTLLNADERLTERDRDNLAQRIMRWAESQGVTDLGQVHETLSDWADRKVAGKAPRSLSLHRPLRHNVRLIDLLGDRKAVEPWEILAVREQFISGPELLEIIEAEAPDVVDIARVLLQKTPEKPIDRDNLSQVVHKLRGVVPRWHNGRILAPAKQVVHVSFDQEGVHFHYVRGYEDDTVTTMLQGYCEGEMPSLLAKRCGMSPTTACTWLYKNMGLPKAKEVQLALRRKKAVELFHKGMHLSDVASALEIGIATAWRDLKAEGISYLGIAGPAPWVYEFTDGYRDVRTALRAYDQHHIARRVTNVRDFFTFINRFQKREGRGPSRDEIYDHTGSDPWDFLSECVSLGIITKRACPRKDYERVMPPNFSLR